MKVGQKIRKLRELKDYTQEYMAAQLDMSVGNYSKIERDEIALTLDRLEKISSVLGINYMDVLSFDERQVFNFINSPNSQGYIYQQYMQSNEQIMKKLNELEGRLDSMENQ